MEGKEEKEKGVEGRGVSFLWHWGMEVSVLL